MPTSGLGEPVRDVDSSLDTRLAQGRCERFRGRFFAREYHVLASHRLKRTQFAADVGDRGYSRLPWV